MRIQIKKLELMTSIGVYDWEREEKQKVILDLDFSLEPTRLMKQDHLEGTIDYSVVAQSLKKSAQKQHFQLIEFFAHSLLLDLHERFPQIKRDVTLEVMKPLAIAGAQGAVVIMTSKDLENKDTL